MGGTTRKGPKEITKLFTLYANPSFRGPFGDLEKLQECFGIAAFDARMDTNPLFCSEIPKSFK